MTKWQRNDKKPRKRQRNDIKAEGDREKTKNRNRKLVRQILYSKYNEKPTGKQGEIEKSTEKAEEGTQETHKEQTEGDWERRQQAKETIKETHINPRLQSGVLSDKFRSGRHEKKKSLNISETFTFCCIGKSAKNKLYCKTLKNENEKRKSLKPNFVSIQQLFVIIRSGHD